MPARTAITKQEAARLAEWIAGMSLPFTLTVREGKARSISQNALLHKWFGEIAQQTHESVDQVKCECKFYQGIPILMAEDQDFVTFVKHLSALSLEQKVAAMNYISVTSVMSAKQLSAMMDAVHIKYATQGVILTDPEALKYEDSAA